MGLQRKIGGGFKSRRDSHTGAFWDHEVLVKVGTVQL